MKAAVVALVIAVALIAVGGSRVLDRQQSQHATTVEQLAAAEVNASTAREDVARLAEETAALRSALVSLRADHGALRLRVEQYRQSGRAMDALLTSAINGR